MLLLLLSRVNLAEGEVRLCSCDFLWLLVRIFWLSAQSMDAVNLLWAELGRALIKVRLAMDCSATGMNETSISPKFSYPTIGDAIAVVVCDCWLASVDITRYFNQFPWCLCWRWRCASTGMDSVGCIKVYRLGIQFTHTTHVFDSRSNSGIFFRTWKFPDNLENFIVEICALHFPHSQTWKPYIKKGHLAQSTHFSLDLKHN
jgi:hypothetical protein